MQPRQDCGARPPRCRRDQPRAAQRRSGSISAARAGHGFYRHLRYHHRHDKQIDACYVASGQEVELTFKFMPGKIYSPKVQAVSQAIATGQVQGAHAVSESRSLACASSWEALGELLVVEYYAYNKRCCLDRFRSDSEAPMSSTRSFCASWR
jgi:hypothetical protein